MYSNVCTTIADEKGNILQNILDIPPKKLAEHFLALLVENKIENPTDIVRHGAETISGLHTNGDDRDMTHGLRPLQLRWYRSLREGRPDYTVYDDDYYLADLWACWIVYSRKYLRSFRDPRGLFTHSMIDELGNVRRVLDLGCGFGYSTIALKQLWPGAEVIGTNIRDTIQFRVAEKLGRAHNFAMLDEGATMPQPVDLVFASEYFEHIEEPIAHLRDIIRQANPAHLVIANTFGPASIGHFDEYIVDGTKLTARQTSRAFKQTLVDAGYELVKTRFWNSRPQYYRRANTP